MSARDVLTVLATMDDAGVCCWLDGGWGVDALLGRQTRQHNDLDLVVVSTDLAGARSVLTAQGFAVLRDWLPTTLAMRDDAGREVDFHPIERTADGGGDQLLPDGTRYHYSPPAAGSVDGRPLPCATVENQVEMHLGYEPRDTDHADMRALAEAFDIELPPPYSPTSG